MQRISIGAVGPADRRRKYAIWAATLAGLAACSSADRSDAGAIAVYQSPRHDFSFEYPDSLDLLEYNPEFVAVGRDEGEAFASEAEIALETGPGESFERFVLERARQACAADGPDLSLQCTDVEMLQAVSTSRGTAGIVFYLRHVATRPGTDEVVESGGRGPFFAFDLSDGTGSVYRAILIRSPVVLAPADVDAALIRRIVHSLRLTPDRGDR